MAGVPQHSPFSDFARAVQAYSYSRLHGGTLAEAEQAARHAFPAADIIAVAQASAGARQAASAFGRIDPGNPTTPTANQARSYGLGRAKSNPETVGSVVVTAAVEYTPGGVMGLSMGTGSRWISVQLEVPIGWNAAMVQEALIAAAQQAVEGPESDYPGTVSGIEVQTAIGQ